ncbi:DUF2993 domain-containing protein [Herbiconiux sp. UC225_62]|uniref:LmeA family phospholipid-binding protein n=1 Tax=Herbiconiux sp. UC225_62 TaxID=3350168 RepID=UPI0036D3B47B
MSTEFHVAPTEPAAPRRHSLRWLWWLIGIVVVLAVLVVVADIGFRAYAEGQAESEIESQLPDSVQGDVDVQIGGFSFLGQLLAGSFGEVQLDAPALTVNGVPISAHVVARDVPSDLTQPVGDIEAAVSMDQDAVNGIVELPGDATLVLGREGVSYEGSVTVFGIELGYRVTGEVTASGTDVVIQPQKATLTQGSNDVDVDLGSILGGLTKDPITVCVAQYLPQSAEVDSLEITDGRATAHLTARDFVLSDDSLKNLGTCP